jgi:hypothetical protein
VNRIVRVATELSCAAAALGLVAFATVADVAFYERHVAPNFCIDRPIGGWIAVRIVAAALAVFLGFYVRPRLGRVVGRTSRRELAITAAGVAVALVAALVVGEILLRRARWDDRIGGHNVADLESDPRLGWRDVPNRTYVFGPPERRFTYAVDARGERVASLDDPVDPAAPTLVVAGESIAFGHSVGWDQTFAALAGHELGLVVVNAGVAAYGTDQIYLHLLDVLQRLAAPRLVVIVFVPVEIRRNVSPRRPHLELGRGGELVRVPAATGPRSLRLFRLFWDEPYHDRHALDVTRALLVATADAVRARGARPLFVVTNYGPACTDPEPDMQKELFVGLPHIRVDLTDADVITPGDDRHPNAAGSKKLAQAIVNYVRRP